MAVGEKTSVVMETQLATETNNGIVRFATDEEAARGDNIKCAINPSQLRNYFIERNREQNWKEYRLFRSSIFSDTDSGWEIGQAQPFPYGWFNYNGCIMNNKFYTLTAAGGLTITDLATMITTTVQFPNTGANGAEGRLFTHKGKLYRMSSLGATSNSKIKIYRLNFDTLTYTQINEEFPADTSGAYIPQAASEWMNSNIYTLDDNRILIAMRSANTCAVAIFNFTTSKFYFVFNQNATGNTMAIQRLSDGNILFGLPRIGPAPAIMRVLKIYITNGDTYTFSTHGEINLGAGNALQSYGRSFELSNGKNISMTYSTLATGGKRIFELDLENLSFDPTKYPDPIFITSYMDFVLWENKILCFENSQGKYETLLLEPCKAENQPPILKIFKGQKFNSVYQDVHIYAIPGQSAFDILRTPQVALADLVIHLNQYDLDYETPIFIESVV